MPVRCPRPRAGPGPSALGNQGSNLLLRLVRGPPRPPDRTKAGLGATEPGVGPGRQVPECGGSPLCCQGAGVGRPSSWLVGSHRLKLRTQPREDVWPPAAQQRLEVRGPLGVGEGWACSTELPEGVLCPAQEAKAFRPGGVRQKPGHPGVPAAPPEVLPSQRTCSSGAPGKRRPRRPRVRHHPRHTSDPGGASSERMHRHGKRPEEEPITICDQYPG